jgi:hypothetical protein
MTCFEITALLACLSGMIAAAAGETAMTRWATPRRHLRSWLLWGALVAAVTSLVGVQTHLGLDAALFAGLVVGLICQPIGRTLVWMGNNEDIRRAVNRADGRRAADRDDDWMKTASWRAPRAAVIAENPAQPRPPASRKILRQVTVATVVIAVGWPTLAVMADGAGDLPRRQMVTDRLADEGYDGVRLRRAWTSSAPCWGGVEYAWTAEAGDGRACVRDGDYVTFRVERDRTSKDPFARPAR